MPQGIPEEVGSSFSTMLEMHDNVVLIHMREKKSKRSRYLIFRAEPDGQEGTRMYLLAEMLPPPYGREVLDSLEPHPDADIDDMHGPTDVPPAFR